MIERRQLLTMAALAADEELQGRILGLSMDAH